jgi:hypothetical protein
MWTNTQHKLQSVQVRFCSVEVFQIPQEGGNHAYMPSSEVQLHDTYTSDVRCPHTCFFTVLWVCYHFTHSEGLPMF